MSQPINPTILVVDDNEAMRYALVRHLHRAGYKTREAGTAREARRMALEKPDLIILDVKLPDGLGYDVCREIKADLSTRTIPVLHISATFRMSSDRVKGLDSGADAFLTGPVEPDELLANVKVLLRLRQATEYLQKSRERLEHVLSSITDVYFAIDGAGRFLELNPAAERVFGKTARELVGRALWVDLPSATGGLFHQGCEMALRERRPVHQEGFSVAGNGWFETHIYPRDDRVEVYARDITERKRAEEYLRDARDELAKANCELERKVRERTAELEEVIEELEHFSYTITHDMRAPLRAMRGFGDLLVEEYSQEASPAAAELVDRIRMAASRMDKLITDALHYTRTVRQDLPPTPVELGPLVRGLLDSYPHLQPPRARVRIDGPLPTVLANEAGLTQCISNLLGNAVKFVAPGVTPEVTVSAEPHGRSVRLWISDNGLGIPKESQGRLFRMFQRLSTGHDGTGIGLALVRKVAQRMGGSVGVESEQGQGSRFWLDLPKYHCPS